MPFSDEDLAQALTLSEIVVLRARISGAKKARAYRELCAYFSSCENIATYSFNENMDSKKKVDYMTRIKLGFVEGFFIDPFGNIHWMPKSLNYETCDQPDSHAFITNALSDHAALVGIYDVEQYLDGLRRAA